MSEQATENVKTQYDITPEEAQRAKLPHELLLINLIFNHVFLFVATLMVMPSFPLGIALVPTISASIITYIVIRSRQAMKTESWYVKCHWELGAKRNRMFMILALTTLGVIAGGWLLSSVLHMSKITTYALIAGLGLLPFMVSLLVLVIISSEAVHQAKHGKIPAWVVKRFPQEALAAQG